MTEHLPHLPIQFEKFEKCTDLASCLKRIRHRVGELQQLMPMLEPDDGRFDGCAGEIGELKTSVLKDFQRMVSLLDRAGKGKLPDDFAEWEEKLDAIDQSLEATFNRVGQLSHGMETRGV